MSHPRIRAGECHIGDLIYFEPTREVGVVVHHSKDDFFSSRAVVTAFWAGPHAAYFDNCTSGLLIRVLVGR